MATPPSHTGWLKKQGHVVRNWKRRFFVLERGRISYFDSDKQGSALKGSLCLENVDMRISNSSDGGDKNADCRIYLIDLSVGKDLLLIADTAVEAIIWKEALSSNIDFAKSCPDLVVSTTEMESSAVWEDGKRQSSCGVDPTTLPIRSISKAWDAEVAVAEKTAQRNSLSSAAEMEESAVVMDSDSVVPSPGWVIKVRREGSTNKVFINVCEHERIPLGTAKRGNKKWPVMLLAPSFRSSVDKNGESCSVLDVVLNPSLVGECNSDKSGELKEEVCNKVIEAIRTREKAAAAGGDPSGGGTAPLDKEFSLPRITKRYKGDEVVPILVPNNLLVASRSASVIMAPLEAQATSAQAGRRKSLFQGIMGGMSASDVKITGSPSGSKVQNTLASTGKPPTANTVKNAPPMLKRFIACTVARPNGCVIKGKPDKAAPRIKLLMQGTKVYAYGRRRMQDGTIWFRLLDGWTLAMTPEGSQRMLRPISDAQPLACKVKRLNFVEFTTSGWIFTTQDIRTVFSMELTFPRDSIVRLERTFAELNQLEEDLKTSPSKDVRDKVLAAGVLNLPSDGQQHLLDDVDSILTTIALVELWLSNIVRTVDAGSCNPLQTFLSPNEEDCLRMESDLMADGGLDGAWGDLD